MTDQTAQAGDGDAGTTTPGARDPEPASRAERFRALHVPGSPLLMPNPWDAGSARLLAHLGFRALATTSSGYAATLGRFDGAVSRDEAVAHAAAIVAAVDVPVSADLENGFAHDPQGVADCVRAACEAGLAGCSIEDFTGDEDDPIYEPARAAERVRAAVEAAAGRIVITARAENHLHGRDDLADTIARLQAYQDAGADVLYAPGPSDAADLGRIVRETGRPVNVLALGGTPPVDRLAQLGVARVSVGGAFAFAATNALARAGRELLEQGTYGYLAETAAGSALVRDAFGS